MLKRSIGIGVLCFAGHAYSAEISITTTEDVVKDDKECSLREAVTYLNMADEDRPEDGYMGCGGKDSSAIIALEKNKVYKLNNKLDIKASMSIKTLYDTTINENVVEGTQNAIIQMAGQDQILNIDDGASTLSAVAIKEVTFQGCGKSVCADKGGIIYNNESLALQGVRFTGGYADQGGALYNVGYSATGGVISTVVISNSIFESNQAREGGALYVLSPSFKISNSVFKNNISTSKGAVMYSASGIADTSGYIFPARVNIIVNSTFYMNSGFAVNLKDGIGLNNLTIMKNTGGIDFDAPSGKSYVANSVIIGNTNSGAVNDCGTPNAADKSILFNNLVSDSNCPVGSTANSNTYLASPALLAGGDEGVCKNLLEDSTSLFCPYKTPKNAFLGYLRPRILLTYADIFSSPILNKGQTKANGTDNFVTCEVTDQRTTERDSDNIWCDRGAIEIGIPDSISKLGADIKPGQVAEFNILESIGDSDLLPSTQCDQVVGLSPDGKPWQDGCLRIKQRDTVSKGITKLDINGNLIYTPNGNWHGIDDFDIQVITTSTRFNEQQERKYLSIHVTINQEPDNTMESKSVNTSGGALGIYSLLALMGLIGVRRYKK